MREACEEQRLAPPSTSLMFSRQRERQRGSGAKQAIWTGRDLVAARGADGSNPVPVESDCANLPRASPVTKKLSDAALYR